MIDANSPFEVLSQIQFKDPCPPTKLHLVTAGLYRTAGGDFFAIVIPTRWLLFEQETDKFLGEVSNHEEANEFFADLVWSRLNRPTGFSLFLLSRFATL